MNADATNEGLTVADCFRQIGDAHPETNIHGYWKNLEDSCNQWARYVTAGTLWIEARKRLDQWRTEYHAATGAALLGGTNLPDFVGKSEKSIRDKLHRQCKLRPDLIPQAIGASPPIPVLNDLVRTRVVCTYIDG